MIGALRSLRARWTLALMAVCVLEAVLVAVAVRVSTARAFDRFVIEESFEAFVEEAGASARRAGGAEEAAPPGSRCPPDPDRQRPRGPGRRVQGWGPSGCAAQATAAPRARPEHRVRAGGR